MPTGNDHILKLTIPCPSCGQWNRIRADRAAHGPRCG